MPFTTYYFKYFSNFNKTVYARQKEKNGTQEQQSDFITVLVDKKYPDLNLDINVINEKLSVTYTETDVNSGLNLTGINISGLELKIQTSVSNGSDIFPVLPVSYADTVTRGMQKLTLKSEVETKDYRTEKLRYVKRHRKS